MKEKREELTISNTFSPALPDLEQTLRQLLLKKIAQMKQAEELVNKF